MDLGCGETLINYALSSIPGDKLHRVVVVTQYPQVAALAEKYSFTPLHNPYPERGQSESIRIGLAALSDCGSCRRWMRRCFRWRISPGCKKKL